MTSAGRTETAGHRSADTTRVDRRLPWRIVREILGPLVLLTLLMIAIGLLLTKTLVHVWPIRDEDAINRSLARDRTHTWDFVTSVLSQIANTPAIVAASVACALILRLVFHRWRESLFLIGAVAAQSAVFVTTAFFVDRHRPKVHQLDDAPPTSSFPSGHTSAALALFGSLAVILSVHYVWSHWWVAWWAVAIVIPLAVGSARLYRGMHHPSDVLASLLSSGVCLLVMARAVLLGGRQGRAP
ncbi:MAG TPA: phosphatase PAP2 family protein [Actinomycetes bacterium]|jgi:membrane-associated phospholipid phosphatase|nr:phosphatase PAP2 family protein [Actinomycetes bacterium]